MYHQFTDLPTYKNHLFVLSPPTLHSLTPSHSDSPLIPSPVTLIPSLLTPLTLIPSPLTPHSFPPRSHTAHTHPQPSHTPHTHTSHITLSLAPSLHTALVFSHPLFCYKDAYQKKKTRVQLQHIGVQYLVRYLPLSLPLPKSHHTCATHTTHINMPHPPQLARDAMNIINFTCTWIPISYQSLASHYSVPFCSIRLHWPKVFVSCGLVVCCHLCAKVCDL